VIFARKATCLTCGCRVLVARYDSIARVLGRIAEIRCPQCGSEMAWRDAEVPSLFEKKARWRTYET